LEGASQATLPSTAGIFSWSSGMGSGHNWCDPLMVWVASVDLEALLAKEAPGELELAK
jgi:hypothetical protein